ncbi:MAG: hypothetical protein ACOYEV_08225 [Candidatus Nanopelagicales bacterium]
MSIHAPRNTGWRKPVSWALLILGAVLFALSGMVGWINNTLVDSANFAHYANEVRRDPQVGYQFGLLVGGAAVDADPDLIAIRPAIEGAAGSALGSAALDGSFQAAMRSAHAALTAEGSEATVLTLADLGAAITVGIKRFFPDLARQLPPDLAMTLAQVGGQEGLAARIIPLVSWAKRLALGLPLAALLAVIAGVWAAPRRRVALIRLGWLITGAGLFLGLVCLGMAIAARAWPTRDASGAIISAGLRVLTPALVVRAVVTVLIGGLIVAGAGALLPQFSLHGQLQQARRLVAWRPRQLWAELLRALAIIGIGVLAILFPTVTAQLLAIVAGLVVFFLGIAELDRVAERYVASDRSQIAEASEELSRPAGGLWVIPLAAGVAIAVLIGLVLMPGAVPQLGTSEAAGVVTDPDACNGNVELCDKAYSEVAFPSTHNSMAAADEKGWYLAEQPTGIVNSLDDGIRVLLVDTWYGQTTKSGSVITAPRSLAAAEKELANDFGDDVVGSLQRTIDRIRREPGVGPEEPFFCHTVCEIGATKVLPVFHGVRKWMDEHPREVITWFIQDMVTPQDTAKLFADSGLADLAYTHQVGQPWPTLRELIDSGKRMVVLMENRSGGTEYPWLMAGFEQAQDTPFKFATAADFNCDHLRGPADAPILLVNHWLASFGHLVTNAEKVNARAVLQPRVQQCQKTRQHPNYIAVNWYNLGDLFAVVDELNGVS